MIKPPPNQRAVQMQDAFNVWKVIDAWQEYFSDVFKAIVALQTSGTTAQRPTKGLYNFRPYGDETLGMPIWYFNGGWIDSQGNSV